MVRIRLLEDETGKVIDEVVVNTSVNTLTNLEPLVSQRLLDLGFNYCIKCKKYFPQSDLYNTKSLQGDFYCSSCWETLREIG